jgi:hypothetical protein
VLQEIKKAGPLLRSVAKAIDFILVAAVAELVPRAGFFAGLLYILISDGLFEGKSIGKKLVRLRVVSLKDNGPCSIRESILRNLIFAAGLALWQIPLAGWVFLALIIAFELVVMIGSKDSMRLGDEVAKTVVIDEK